MDRKPKIRRVAREEVVKEDPAQSERFIEAGRALELKEGEAGFSQLVEKIIAPRGRQFGGNGPSKS